MRLGVVIPACDEEGAVGQVVARCRRSLDGATEARVVVADNASTDSTARVAAQAGAEVVRVPRRGYGAACLGALRHLNGWPEVLLFLDGDGSSRPEEMELLLGPIRRGEADLTIGRRRPDSPMTLPQRWGNRLATTLIRLRWGRRFHDLGPYRAVRAEALRKLRMRDTTWGWTVEMQIQAVRHGLVVCEVPVSWEARLAGASKISGTVAGVTRAGARILWTIGSYALRSGRSR